MSARPGINVTERRWSDGGVSPNAVVPAITAEIRCFWPPRAGEAEVLNALAAAYAQAISAVLERRRTP